MKDWTDLVRQMLALFAGLFFLAIVLFCLYTPDKVPLSETEELLSDIRNNSNDREIMDCARLHLKGKEEIFKDDARNFYDCKKRVLQDRLKRAIPEIPDAKN
ncbi:hypothetical protein [uncultured Desulfovibrio sp.]|uniref:hypothetical protein n=1 Tax=uncultured Desulfovibrio sp. TaxID=167968 RepID=UPI002637CBAB|nr:hypothetical protein [uncultured Desulfovibrio sp.]